MRMLLGFCIWAGTSSATDLASERIEVTYKVAVDNTSGVHIFQASLKAGRNKSVHALDPTLALVEWERYARVFGTRNIE